MVRTQLVEALLRLPNPRSCLVWRRGLPAWMAAGEVAEIDRLITPFVPPRTGSFGRVDPAAVSQAAAEADARARGESGAHPRPGGASRAARTAAASARPSSLIYAGAGAGIVGLALIVWFAWPRARQPRPSDATAPGVITLKEGGLLPGSPSPAPLDPSPGGAVAPTGSLPAASARSPTIAAWSGKEQVLPSGEIAKIRAVAAWSRKTLTLTIYNGSSWRVTELDVRPSRLKDEAFVDDEKPLVLRPLGSDVDQGVDELLNKVAPERRKSGVNPLDTGKFECQAGDRPDAFRAPIVSARGYPPS